MMKCEEQRQSFCNAYATMNAGGCANKLKKCCNLQADLEVMKVTAELLYVVHSSSLYSRDGNVLNITAPPSPEAGL